GRSRARQIEDFIDFRIKWEANVMSFQLEIGVRQQMAHISSASRVKIVYAKNLVAAIQQSFTEVRANKSGPPSHENATFAHHVPTPLIIPQMETNAHIMALL